MNVVRLFLFLAAAISMQGAENIRTFAFHGLLPEHKIPLEEIDPAFPSDWTGYTHLVMELRATSPQRFALWAYTANGPRRIEMQLFGQNVWLRASIPLNYFKGMDQSGTDLASSINRRTKSFWMSVWGPFGDLKSVEALGFAMQYPINQPRLEVRSIRLLKQDVGSEFLAMPVVDEFGQWAHVDYPRKIQSRKQLEREWAEEAKGWGTGADYGYCELGGYKAASLKGTGFFRVEQVNGVWWFVDPHGHPFLSTSVNGLAGFERRGREEAERTRRRIAAWGFNTGGGENRPRIVYFRVPRDPPTTFLGVPDVYAEGYPGLIDIAARQFCTPLKDDPLLIGYFMGNEPPWGDRESEVVDMILAGPDTATKAKLKDFLAVGDNPKRRREFIVGAFGRYLELVCGAVRKYDPNHLNLGIRYGGKVADEVLKLARIFDVCSINVYEYEPTKQLERAHRLSGRPILIGEFHNGVPENGLGSGLVQTMNQTERGKGYRYYVEQAAALPYFLGAHWFQWQDQPVTGRRDGENYNIGFVDVTDRPYPELVEAAKATHRVLHDVHASKARPFAEKPKASEYGSPSSPWDVGQ